jgi:hypothetical protein
MSGGATRGKANWLAKVTVLLAALTLSAGTSCGGGETASGIVVDSTADTNSRDGVVTLREAILLATGGLAVTDLDSGEADNVGKRPGPDSSDTITFDASVFQPPEGGTISLTEPLPGLSTGADSVDASQAGVIVDGGHQTFECLTIDSAGNLIKGLQIQKCLVGVMIKAGAASNVIGGSAPGEGNVISDNDEGIVIAGAGADSNAIKGNFIGVDPAASSALPNHNGVDIREEARGNVVGGSEPGERNVISGNKGVGVTIAGNANLVLGNYIGTDRSGTSGIPNGMEGIWIATGAQDNIIGGSSAEERNVISGNDLFGLNISGSGATANLVRGNYIGIDATGTRPLPNGHGLVVSDGSQNNVIGGSERGQGNVISGNDTGVLIRGSDTSENTFLGNYIGTDPTGSEMFPNARGIWLLEGAHHNTIGGTGPGEGNVISGNNLSGVDVEGSATVSNTIRGNSIHSNHFKGIDNISNGNGGLKPPVITGVSPIAGVACPGCTVDIYSDSSDEGEIYEGSTVADADGAFIFEAAPSGPNVTATATDGDGNTSVFAQPFLAAAG